MASTGHGVITVVIIKRSEEVDDVRLERFYPL